MWSSLQYCSCDPHPVMSVATHDNLEGGATEEVWEWYVDIGSTSTGRGGEARLHVDRSWSVRLPDSNIRFIFVLSYVFPYISSRGGIDVVVGRPT